MKQKIKRHYRSAVSVFLSVCMLISCMTVGLIATDAARVTEDEAVGATDTTLYYAINTDYTVKYNVCDKYNSDTDQHWVSGNMTKTSNTHNGKVIYSASFKTMYDGARTIQFQLYDGETWKSQVEPFKKDWTGVSTYNNKLWDPDSGSSGAWVSPTADITYTLGSHVNKVSVTGGNDNNSGTIIPADTSTPVVVQVSYDAGYQYDSATSSADGAVLTNNNTTFTYNSVDTNHTLEINAANPLGEGLYSLSGNVTDKYIVGSEIVKPKNIDTSTWWSTFHEDLAIDEVVGSAGDGKFKIVFTTTDYAGGINIGLAGRDGVQYAFNYNGTPYNYNGGDLDLTTSEMQTAGQIENVYVYNVDSSNPGGSLKLLPNTTYTITIDQTERLNNNAANPRGNMTIKWNKVYANAIAMTSDFDINTRRYNTPEKSTTGGTATASPTEGNKGELDPTFTASENSGYTFAGWYSDPKCTELVRSDASYSENGIEVEHTYYALFKQEKPATERTITVTVTGDDYGTVTPGPGLEYVGINDSTPGTSVITYKAYDGASTYLTAKPNEATSSAMYELGTVGFTPAGAGTESNGKITLSNISADTSISVPFTERTTYKVTLTGENGKISAQAKKADGSNYTGANNSVSNVTSGYVNVPIGGKVTLTAGDANSGYDFSNFELETGKYKRTSDQNEGTSPMTIRPLGDMTAKAKFTSSVDIGTLYIGSKYYGCLSTGRKDGQYSTNIPIYYSDKDDNSKYLKSKLRVGATEDLTNGVLQAGKQYYFIISSKEASTSTAYSDTLYQTASGNVTLTTTVTPADTSWNDNVGIEDQSSLSTIKLKAKDNVSYIVITWGWQWNNEFNGSGGIQQPDGKYPVQIDAYCGGSSPTIDTSGYRKIYAMDGVETKTADFGDTVIINPMGLLESDIEDDQGNSEAYVSTREKYNVYYYDPNREDEITFRVQTTIANHGSNQANEYLGVRGFVYNGKSVEAKDGGNGVYYADITMKASDVVDINGKNDVKNGSNYPILEIVPVYYNTTLDDEDDCVKFYVDANSMQNKYGFNLGYYAWYKDASGPSGTDVQMNYPGQPLLKEGTKYYTYLPEKYTPNNQSGLGNNDLAGVLLDNLWENCDAHKRVLESWGCVSTDANYQTFDYEDPLVIKDLGANIIEFVVKYEETNSNHRDGTHWYNNNTKYNKAENLKGKNASDYSHTIPITKPAGASRLNGFEQLRNYDNKPVDVYGNELTSAQNKYDDALFIVSVGNQTVAPANDWDTVWMIYDHDGTFIEASNPATYIEAAIQRDAIKNKPAYINYEKFLDGYEKNQQYSNPQGTGNSGDRIDGRWLYSKSTDNSEAHIRVATLGKNGDTLNFMTFENGASGARIAYDDDSCDGLVQTNQRTPHPGYSPENTTQEDLFGRKTEFSDRKTKAKAVLNQPNGYKFVGFYMQKVGVLGDEEDNYFSLSKADYDVMDRESATVAKFTNARNNYIVAIVEKVPSSNLHLTHEMYGGTGAHNGAGQFYLKAEVLAPENASGSRAVIASSNGFVDGSEGYEFEYLNGIARKVTDDDPENPDLTKHYMVRVTIRTVMAGTNTLYQWYNKDLETGGYNEIDDNNPASYGKSGTQEKVILVDVNTLYGAKEDVFTYTNLNYYSDIEIPGTVYFKHEKTTECPGDGTLTTRVKVYDSSDNVIKTFESNGTVEVPSAWTGRESGYKLEVTLISTPDSRSAYVSTYKEAAATNVVAPAPTITDGVGNATPYISPLTGTPNDTKIPVSAFYKNIAEEGQPEAWVFDTEHNTFTFYSKFKEANRNLTITKKLTSGTDADTTFSIAVTKNGSAYQGAWKLNGTDQTDTTTGIFTVKQKDVITIEELPIGDTISVTETNIPFNYSYAKATLGTDNTNVTTEGIQGYSYTVADDVDLKIWNAPKNIKYKIVYTFPSRAYTIGDNAGPRFGNLSKTVEGTINGADPKIKDYFDTTAETPFITQAMVRDLTPYEKNFLVKMEWAYNDYTHSTEGEGDALTYTAALSATNGDIPTKHVTFYFPYDIQRFKWSNNIEGTPGDTSKRGHTYGPADFGTPTQTDYQSTLALEEANKDDGFGTDTFPYQGNTVVWEKHTATRTKSDGTTETFEEWSDHCTWAAETISGGGTFAYWSIRAQNRNAAKVNGDYPYVEVARCYEQRFNYTLFDDYKVYAIYSTSTGEFAPDTNGKMEDVYATINFLEYSRNHWNNSAYGSYPASYQTKERNIVYTDFDVAFENAYELIQAAGSTTEVGVLVEKVGTSDIVLNPEADDYATIYANCATNNASTIDKAAIITYIANSGTSRESNNTYDKRPIAKSSITNKGRTEYGYTLSVATEADVSDVQNVLYRAYSYVRIKNPDENGSPVADTVVLSDTPVYFSIKYTAER